MVAWPLMCSWSLVTKALSLTLHGVRTTTMSLRPLQKTAPSKYGRFRTGDSKSECGKTVYRVVVGQVINGASEINLRRLHSQSTADCNWGTQKVSEKHAISVEKQRFCLLINTKIPKNFKPNMDKPLINTKTAVMPKTFCTHYRLITRLTKLVKPTPKLLTSLLGP